MCGVWYRDKQVINCLNRSPTLYPDGGVEWSVLTPYSAMLYSTGSDLKWSISSIVAPADYRDHCPAGADHTAHV